MAADFTLTSSAFLNGRRIPAANRPSPRPRRMLTAFAPLAARSRRPSSSKSPAATLVKNLPATGRTCLRRAPARLGESRRGRR
jgi:hypothetical protein